MFGVGLQRPALLGHVVVLVVGALQAGLGVAEKHLLRKAKKRSIEATWRWIGSLIRTFSPAECRNNLLIAGYTDNA